jgi:hypothetical protein
MPTLSKWSAGFDCMLAFSQWSALRVIDGYAHLIDGPVHDRREWPRFLMTTFEINPILRHLPPQLDDNRLEYNVLFSLSTASLFKDKQEVSWVDGRDEPAVLPRLETLSPHFGTLPLDDSC